MALRWRLRCRDTSSVGSLSSYEKHALTFTGWSLWSKDIIILITPDSLAGPQAWVDAYHDAHDPRTVASLPLKSGALQGAVAIDYTQKERFSAVHIVYDGVNGQLPNLDLINSVVNIADGQMGMGATIQDMWKHDEGYKDRLQTVLRGMMKQGLGVSSGPHSSFIPYHVDAVTIQPYGEGWQDEMAMGRLVEGTFRSLNNLLEKLHQSFFFYLLMDRKRFVSIGTYLPSAMLIAANFTIMAIALWVKSGTAKSAAPANGEQKLIEPAKEGEQTVATTTAESPATSAAQATPTAERDLFLPLGIVALCQFLGVVPLYLFNHLPVGVSASPRVHESPDTDLLQLLNPAFLNFTIFNAGIPILISGLLAEYKPPTLQQYYLIKSFSLLLLGMFLSALATLNYSLAFFVGLLAAPLSFMRPWPNNEVMRWVSFGVLFLASPPVVAAIGALAWGVGIEEVLRRAAFGWDVWGMYTAIVVWCVWWPAWLAAGVVVLGTPGEKTVDVEKKNV
jgi:GPI-anchor transamidase subunit GAA1